ncbi:uncharacterized protein LOC129805290 [Phlebotomus papatasi]|uniref:uncharacterized protein LOC129805290 n=1 Tax=Phlebotomus papatasi TaxID=29031 RepID=UPI002484491B|nr:uncharacterized protein LOC129805290 [Phlebotomus papatasi]
MGDEKGKKKWQTKETKLLLQIVHEKEIVAMMDSKKFRNQEVFAEVEKEFLKQGYQRDVKQIEIKFKNLKQEYNRITSWNNTSGNPRREHEFQQELDLIFLNRPREVFHQLHGCESTEEESTGKDIVQNPEDVDDVATPQTSSSSSKLKKRKKESDLMAATKVFLAAQKELFEKEAEREEKENEKDRELLRKFLEK